LLFNFLNMQHVSPFVWWPDWCMGAQVPSFDGNSFFHHYSFLFSMVFMSFVGKAKHFSAVHWRAIIVFYFFCVFVFLLVAKFSRLLTLFLFSIFSNLILLLSNVFIFFCWLLLHYSAIVFFTICVLFSANSIRKGRKGKTTKGMTWQFFQFPGDIFCSFDFLHPG